MSKISMSMAIRDALYEEMKRDNKVFVMGEDVGINGESICMY